MKPSSIFLLITALAAASSLSAKDHEKDNTTVTSESVQMSVDDIVAGRRSAYWMSAGLFGGMFGIANSGGDVKGLAFTAQALAGWAKALPGMFPEGSVNKKSNALPSVWSDQEGFNALAKLYAESADRLSETAKTGDKEAFKTQLMEVRKTCSACHDKYRRDRSKEQ